MPVLHVHDVDLYYEMTGEGPPLVFLHGLGSSTRDWEAQVPAFAGAYRVLTVDLRGHGRSARPPGPYWIPTHAADVAALLRALDLAPAHVVGLSMGGMVAFQLAVSEPGLVRTLTVVNSTPDLVLHSVRRHLIYRQRRLLVRLFGMARTGRWLAERLFPKPDQESLRRTFAARWAENDRRAYLDAVDGLVGWSVEDHLPAITCPVLVVAADADYTPVAYKEAYTAKIPSAELLVIPDARHALPAEQPDTFNAALWEFLGEATGDWPLATGGQRIA